MTRRSLRLLMLPLLAGAALVACGEDSPEEGAGGAGGASAPSTSAAQSSAPDPSESEPTEETSGGTGDTGDIAATCLEMDEVITGITDQYPEGVGLADGEVPGEEQIAALTALIDGLSGIEVPDSDLAALREDVLGAAQTIVDRGAAGEPLTQDDADAFTGAMSDMGILCEGAS